MLILQRKEGESIKIGEQIEISVVEIGSAVVKLAISAPKDISILRKELLIAADVNKESVFHRSELEALRNFVKENSDERESG